MEIGSQAVSEHWNVESIANITELSYLWFRKELGFVDEDAVDFFVVVFALCETEQVIRGSEGNGICAKTDTRSDFSISETIIEIGTENKCSHSTFLIVIAGLQQDCGFSCVHRGVVKIEFRHGSSCAVVKEYGDME